MVSARVPTSTTSVGRHILGPPRPLAAV